MTQPPPVIFKLIKQLDNRKYIIDDYGKITKYDNGGYKKFPLSYFTKNKIIILTNFF